MIYTYVHATSKSRSEPTPPPTTHLGYTPHTRDQKYALNWEKIISLQGFRFRIFICCINLQTFIFRNLGNVELSSNISIVKPQFVTNVTALYVAIKHNTRHRVSLFKKTFPPPLCLLHVLLQMHSLVCFRHLY